VTAPSLTLILAGGLSASLWRWSTATLTLPRESCRRGFARNCRRNGNSERCVPVRASSHTWRFPLSTFTSGFFRATLPAGPVCGPQLWMALRSERAPELLVASLEGYVDAAGAPAGAFHWFPFPDAPPRPG